VSSLEPSRGNRPSRAQREKRAYNLVMVGGTAGVVAVIGTVLAIIDVIGGGIPLLAAIVAIVCFVMFRNMTRPRR
jgi:hypothetical protein